MNKHFSDSTYYLQRAAEHAKLGLTESLRPLATRARRLAGREPEPEPTRLEAVRATVADRTGRARNAVDTARTSLPVVGSKSN